MAGALFLGGCLRWLVFGKIMADIGCLSQKWHPASFFVFTGGLYILSAVFSRAASFSKSPLEPIEPSTSTTKVFMKKNLEWKVCVTCNLPFNWRKKWRLNWEAVKYCSKKCVSKKLDNFECLEALKASRHWCEKFAGCFVFEKSVCDIIN